MPDIDDYHDGGCLDWLFGELRVQEQQLGVYKSLDLLEDFYQDLRYLFYEKKISLKDILIIHFTRQGILRVDYSRCG